MFVLFLVNNRVGGKSTSRSTLIINIKQEKEKNGLEHKNKKRCLEDSKIKSRLVLDVVIIQGFIVF